MRPENQMSAEERAVGTDANLQDEASPPVEDGAIPMTAQSPPDTLLYQVFGVLALVVTGLVVIAIEIGRAHV